MSQETIAWLNSQTLIGFTDERGNAWHYREENQGGESNHYSGAIPVKDVRRRLFSWEAVEHDIFVELDGKHVVIPDRKAIARSDNNVVMGIFKPGYQCHQYDEWLVKAVESLLDDSLQIGSAGLLKKGAVAWVQIEVPKTIVTPEGVSFRPHLLARTSFDGSLATGYQRTVTNTVCDNTMAAAIAGGGETFKLKHTKYSSLKLMDAKAALDIVHGIGDEFTAEVSRLCATKVSSKQWESFLNEIAPLPDEDGRGKTMAENKRTELQRLYRSDARCAEWQDTAFGVVQTMNTYAHHSGIIRGNGDKEKIRAERNMERAVKGAVDELDSSTLATLEAVMA